MEKEDTGAVILKAALELFSEMGFHSVTTKEIAKRACVNEVTLFRHFQSKEKLLEAVLERFIQKPDIQILAEDYKEDPYQFLMEVGRSLSRMFVENLPIVKMRLQYIKECKIQEKSDVPLKKFPAEVRCLVKDYFTRYYPLVPDSQAENIASVFIITIFGLFLNINIIKSIEPKPDFEECLDLMVSGLLLKSKLLKE